MRLADDDRRELERRYLMPQEIEHGFITCEVPAATCVDRKQLLGVIYWQGCAAFPRDLARRRAGAQAVPRSPKQRKRAWRSDDTQEKRRKSTLPRWGRRGPSRLGDGGPR